MTTIFVTDEFSKYSTVQLPEYCALFAIAGLVGLSLAEPITVTSCVMWWLLDHGRACGLLR